MCGNLGIRFLDSKDPKHTLCHEIAFVTKSHLSRFTRFLGIIFPSFDNEIDLPLLLNHMNTFAIDKIGWLSTEPAGYR